MTEMPKIILTQLSFGDAASYYTEDEIERFGYKNFEFNGVAVFASFRVSFNDQAFLLRV